MRPAERVCSCDDVLQPLIASARPTRRRPASRAPGRRTGPRRMCQSSLTAERATSVGTASAATFLSAVERSGYPFHYSNAIHADPSTRVSLTFPPLPRSPRTHCLGPFLSRFSIEHLTPQSVSPVFVRVAYALRHWKVNNTQHLAKMSNFSPPNDFHYFSKFHLLCARRRANCARCLFMLERIQLCQKCNVMKVNRFRLEFGRIRLRRFVAAESQPNLFTLIKFSLSSCPRQTKSKPESRASAYRDLLGTTRGAKRRNESKNRNKNRKARTRRRERKRSVELAIH